jgi:hypothetical protein
MQWMSSLSINDLDALFFFLYTVPSTMGWRWFKAIWNGFFRSRERKEENPRNY